MAAEETSFFGQIRETIQGLPGIIKIGAIIVVALIAVWFIWNTVSDMLRSWEPIAMQVQGAAKADVLTYLRNNQVDYKIEGDTIFVPRDRVDELRIEMAGLDLAVSQLKGLERLESVGMGDTEKTIAAKRQLALQEEIQKALNSLSAVDSSQVNLALPSESGFLARDDTPAKASIILKLRGGATLTPVQVHGIQNVVANSIQGLNSDNVIIVDQHSNPLSQSAEGDEVFSVAQMNEEKRIRQNIMNILEPALGANRVTVAASVELTRESKRTTEKKIENTQGAEVYLRSVESEETGGTRTGGIPGTETNTGEGSAATTGGTASSSSSTEEERRTDYPTTLIETELTPGDIKRKSVSVVIDLKKEVTTDEDGREVTQYVSWGDETLQEWRDALKRAAGIDDQRGDSLSLTEISFDNFHQMSDQIKMEQRTITQRRMFDIFDWSDWTALIKIPLLILAIFVIIWYVVRPIGKIVLEPLLQLPSAAAAQIPEELPKTVEELEAEIEGKLVDEIDLAAKEVTKGTILKKRIAELAKNEPESFTQLLRTWLNE
jgi:flagellar M-ring protein FliF